MVDKKLGGAGLRGQVAGETQLCTVGQEGSGLTYLGYDIQSLADGADFEEVAYLLQHGELPGRTNWATIWTGSPPNANCRRRCWKHWSAFPPRRTRWM